MAHLKDWFRRRRPLLAGAPLDPFAEDDVLDLGRGAVMLRESAPPLLPPARPAPAGTFIPASAFTVRPELARRDGPRTITVPPAEPAVRAAAPSPRAGVERREAGPDPQRERGPGVARLAEPRLPGPLERPVDPRPAPPPQRAPAERAAFTLAAPGPAWLRNRPGPTETSRVNARLRDAFTPTRPKHDAALFSGRFREMQRIIAAIEEERAHVVVYGERGSGKTSLCNILAGKATEAGYFVLQFSCSSGIGFDDIFRHFLRRIPASFLVDGIGSRVRVENFEQLLPERAPGIAELVDIFIRIHERHVILVIDEYDRVVSDEVKSKLAELIKIMSDAAAPVTLLIIGVADDVRDLFGKHPSLQRTLVTVPMPLMSRRDIDALIAAGEARADIAFAADVRASIIDFAQGLPYHAQLLCLFAARSAVRRGARQVEGEDFRYAVECAAEAAEARVREAYGLAVGSPEQSSFQDVLFHAARARSDEFGSFSANDVAAAAPAGDGETSLLALQYPLKKLTEPERGAVLRRLACGAGLRYQFSSQMMRHYVLTRQAALRGLI